VWDYDGVMTPSLLTIRVNGRAIDAVAAVSKTGFTYVFDRVTGEPVWPIEERPVPQTDIAGEKTSPTQPFPVKPPPFMRQEFTLDDVVDFTPEIRAKAMEILKGLRMGPIFTPPSKEGTVMRPSNVGGANWGGASVDPERGILYVKAKTTISIVSLAEQQRQAGSDPPQGWSYFPYKHTLARPTFGEGMFVSKPPYGTITAIDLNRGEILWQVPSGDIPEIRNDPMMKGVDPPPLGAIGNAGLLVTAGGLLFTAPGDKKLYALDPENGNVLWSADLPHNAEGTPMTYRSRDGRQFVVVAAGEGKDATLVAFALP
jgi:quinoprotein glucose dehydrogenase